MIDAEKYSKEALVEFIRTEVPLDEDYVERVLHVIQFRQRTDELLKGMADLNVAMESISGRPEYMAEWMQMMAQWEQLHEEFCTLCNIQVSGTSPA